MRTLLVGFCVVVSTLFGLTGAASADSQQSLLGLRYPALSPDGKQVAFSYQGDIWVVARSGGQAVRLTAHPAYDYLPRWSPDGTQLLFTSKRTGNLDVFVMSSKGGNVRQLTFHSAVDVANDWSPDGKWIVFESNRDNRRSLFQMPVAGGQPVRMIGGYWNTAHNGRVSPNGQHVLFSQSTESLYYWWRKGYVGPNNANIYLWDRKAKSVKRLTQHKRNDFWPMWSADGKSFYFMSERSGIANLFQGSLAGKAPAQITTFQSGPVRWPSISRNGAFIVYERNFKLWVTNLKTKQSTALNINVTADQTRLPVALKHLSKVTEFVLSPDGKKVAFVMRGDVFVSDAQSKTVVHRVTKTMWEESSVTWHPNSREILFLSGHRKEHWLMRKTIFGPPAKALWKSKTWLAYPRWNPKGDTIVYVSEKQIHLLKPGSSPTSVVTAELGGWMSDAVHWSYDGQYLIYLTYNQGRGDYWALRLKDKKTTRLTPTAANDADGALSHNNKFFFFRSNRYGSDWFTKVGDDDLYVLPLQWQPPKFKLDQLEKLFKVKGKKKKTSKEKATSKAFKKSTTKPSKKHEKSKKGRAEARPEKKGKGKKDKSKKGRAEARPKKKKQSKLELNPRDLLERTRRLTALSGHDRHPTPSPNGKYVMFFSNSLGYFTLWLAKFDKKKVRLKTPKPFAAGLRFPHAWSNHGLTWGPKSKAVYVLRRGSVYRIAVPSGKIKKLRLSKSVRVNHQKEYVQLFHEVWRTMRDFFYDSKMNGADWNAVYIRYLPAAQQLQTEEDWRDLMNEMLGELNASHLGVSSPRQSSPSNTGRLGADFKAEKGLLKLTKIWRHGPLYKAKPKMNPGKFLLKINGQSIKASTNLAKVLRDTVGKRVTLIFGQSLKDKKPTVVKVKPTSNWPVRWLRYLAWVRERRNIVTRLSRGKIGYLHMRGMGRSDMLKFLRDFPTYVAQKKAAIIDIRFNWGGNIHDRILQILSRRLYSYWRARGLSRWNQPFFPTGHKPMALLINESSLSDAEMTANGFKSLRLGTVIGVGTYRWLIFTSGRSLVGGRRMRVPFWGCYSLGGKDLEKSGVTPDIKIRNTFSDRLHNRDPQLKKAVEVLLKKLK